MRLKNNKIVINPRLMANFASTLSWIIACWVLYPITTSALMGDDVPNSMRSAVLVELEMTRWEFVVSVIEQWLEYEGRFFPISTIENVLIFTTFETVTSYKWFQFLFTLALLTTISIIAAKLLSSYIYFSITLLTLVASLQTRYWYDPTFGFGLLLQSTQLKFFLALLFLFKYLSTQSKYSILWICGSTALWLLALLQYEVVITLIPCIVAVILLHREDKRKLRFALLFFGMVNIIFFVSTLWLRSTSNNSPAYQIRTSWNELVPTYFKQLSGALPFSGSIWERGTPSPDSWFGEPTLLLLLLLLGVCIKYFWNHGLIISTAKQRLLILTMGLNLFLGPSVTTAVSVRWQSEVDWGLSYLSVAFAYTGMGFLFLWMIMTISVTNSRQRIFDNTIISALIVVLVLASASNSLNNQRVSDLLQEQRRQRQIYVDAVRAGFLDVVPDGSLIVSSVANQNTWVSDFFTSWLGGPEDLTFVVSPEEFNAKCPVTKRCESMFTLEYLFENQSAVGLQLYLNDQENKHEYIFRDR